MKDVSLWNLSFAKNGLSYALKFDAL
jgi:hypothetical protein